MTIGSLLAFAVGATLKLPAAVEVAGVELGTMGVILLILVILVILVGLALGIYSFFVFPFLLGSGR